MTYMNLLGELSTLLKVAWVAWLVWGIVQITWRRRARTVPEDFTEKKILASSFSGETRQAAARKREIKKPFEKPVAKYAEPDLGKVVDVEVRVGSSAPAAAMDSSSSSPGDPATEKTATPRRRVPASAQVAVHSTQ